MPGQAFVFMRRTARGRPGGSPVPEEARVPATRSTMERAMLHPARCPPCDGAAEPGSGASGPVPGWTREGIPVRRC
jgi:hypothetical protein